MAELSDILDELKALAVTRSRQLHDLPTIAAAADIEHALSTLPRTLPADGAGLKGTWDLLRKEVAPALAPGHAGSRYFGFVTGGVLPEALVADWLVSLFDQNVQVHLPKETLSTYIERLSINMVLELLGLQIDRWSGTVTTGATSSNVLALASAREAVLRKYGLKVSEDGLAGSPGIKVFVTQPHASVHKAASLVGVGRKNVIDVGHKVLEGAPIEEQVKALDFDLNRLDEELRACTEIQQGAIVIAGLGEVNTGALTDQIPSLRRLCNRYGAWLHIDAAFSAFVCLLQEFAWVSEHLSLVDSITSDAHKQLNVPYDAGLLFIRTRSAGAAADCELYDVCSPGKSCAPAYLTAQATKGIDADAIHAELAQQPSPLNMNIENSRRFRALPLYAGLVCQGRAGYAALVEGNVDFARRVEAWMRKDSKGFYEVLTPKTSVAPPGIKGPTRWTGRWGTTIVLFRAHPQLCPVPAFCDAQSGHLALTDAIKATRQMYVTPTSFMGTGAIRLAVSNWSTDEQDFHVVTRILTEVMEST
ncbi:PLP-dependent transferase [Tilletiaria anomala UBC 951]|uniref:PLP-dependent transferase n=1 Tax=Tilletiaria anomala (strain ATCC 24038 / CBS 436.72 / UBC 951) TaxID=1037660 RepID=A0A066W5E5_TILAU|nr:PLP-dependent transferase [Tilletiaria anomala UBC 951]KDN47758.1 PLP-dependent transferase [Tilletiaria anomala UBC 951]